MDTPHRVVGYGTLLAPHSLRRTAPKLLSEPQPCVVHGYRRLYNLRIPGYLSSRIPRTRGIERSAANVEPDADSAFNAMLIEVDDRGLRALDRREAFYRRMQVIVQRWEDRDDPDAPLVPAIAYSAAHSRHRVSDPARLMPRWRDITLARVGAYAISDAFGQMFDETTFLADGLTPAVDRYADRWDQMRVEYERLR